MQKLILPIDEFKPTAGYKNAKYRKYWVIRIMEWTV